MTDTLKIGPLVYRITEIPELKSEDDKRYLFGNILYEQQEVRLEANMTPIRKRMTLIHEALHGIVDMRGLNLSENAVISLGVALYELIRDNPWLGEAVE